MRTKF